MNVWLCPVKPKNWRIVQRTKVFGVPRHVSRIMDDVRPGDLLVFHVLKKEGGIVAVCKVVSEPYEDHQNIWGKERYPIRVHIQFIPSLIRNEGKAVPLSSLFGEIDGKEGIKIEPYLRNVWLKRISKKQYQRLEKYFQEKGKPTS
jgi:hypothetical protein